MYFDASEVEPDSQDTFTPLPAGWYHGTITGSEAHYGKNSAAGEMLKLEVEINPNEHPEYANRRVWSYLCIEHEKDVPRNIARGQLSAICHAIGLFPMEEPQDLLGQEIMVRLKIRAAKDGYDASNDIAGWQSVASAEEEAPEQEVEEEEAEERPKPAAKKKTAAKKPRPGAWR